MARIGLIDVDKESRGKVTFPNLSLMKLASFHKSQGDSVEWNGGLLSNFDRVYMSKVFGDEYSRDYPYFINADEVIRGGSGYAIKVDQGEEIYTKSQDWSLPDEINHSFPDYSIYGITDSAYGFISRGCPRDCGFCPVSQMQGRKTRIVADLEEFYNGQRKIVLLDPNITALKFDDFEKVFKKLEDSGASVDFSQGLDARLLTKEKAELLNRIKWERLHFAWDNPREDLTEDLKTIKRELPRGSRNNITVYILTNYNSTHAEDLERMKIVKALGFQPYITIYRRTTAPKVTKDLQRYTNRPWLIWSLEWEDYKR